MKKKMRLFKNDRFGIKEKIFNIRIRKSLKDCADINSRIINLTVRGIDSIGIPRTDDEVERLRTYVAAYDKSITELETHVKYARLYLESSDK